MRERRGLGERLLASLVGLYPQGFRARVGPDLLETCRLRLAEARSRGAFAHAAFWVTDGSRLLLDAVLERWSVSPKPIASGWPRVGRASRLESLLRDLAVGARRLRRSPGFTLLATTTLGLGIGAATAIFSVADAVLLRPLPYAAPQDLFLLEPRFGELELGSQSAPNLRDIRAGVAAFSEVAGASDDSPALTGDGEPDRVTGMVVTEDYFELLEVAPAIGRAFLIDDHASGARRVTVVSHGVWQRRLGGTSNVLHESIDIDGETHQIIGVMGPGYRDPEELGGFEPPAVWLPLRVDDPEYAARESYGFKTFARLAPGVAPEVARARLGSVAREMSEANDMSFAGHDIQIEMAPLKQSLVGETSSKIHLLLVAVASLLLVACANVGSLFLVRGSIRQGEFEVRAALGAGRGRLLQQLLAEAAAVSALACMVGIALAKIGVSLFQRLGPADTPRLAAASVDERALLVATLVAAASALGFAIAPLWGRSALETSSFRSGGRTTEARRGRRLRSGLVVAEVALAFVLVSAAALLVRSLVGLLDVDPGFDVEGLVALEVRPPAWSLRDDASGVPFYSQLLERAGTLPGVISSALVQSAPASQGGTWSHYMVEGRPDDWKEGRFDRQNAITPDALRTLGVRVLAGRGFSSADAGAGPPVVVVNQAAARRYWGDASPVGTRVRQGGPDSESPWVTVVGVVSSVHQRGPQRDPEPEFFFCYGQERPPRMTLIVRSTGALEPLAAALRETVWQIDRDTPIDRILTMPERVAGTLVEPRFYAALLASFGSLAFALAVIGVYGNVAYNVSREMKEMAIRMALGAHRPQVLGLVVGRGGRLLAIGLAIGTAVAVSLNQYLESLLFGVSPGDPATLAAAATALVLAGLLACWVPAERATRLDPNRVLRAD